MSLAIVDRSGVVSTELREFAERRLWFALARFDSRIQRISVVVAEANGCGGAPDKSCRVTIKLRRADDVVLTVQDADLAACLARAAERVGRAVARAIERTQRVP